MSDDAMVEIGRLSRLLTQSQAEVRRLRERETLLNSVVERQALGLMKIRTAQGEPIQIARETMDACADEQSVAKEG